MKVAKWGNSLAVRIPAALALELGLKDGDQVKLARNSNGVLGISFEERHRNIVEWMRGPISQRWPRNGFDPRMLFELTEAGEANTNRQDDAADL